MERILAVFQNDILLVSLSAWFIAQMIKVIMNLIVERRFSFERMFGDGGMPSGHSATVMAMATTTGWTVGFNTPIFAVSVLFAAVVMRDACGVRREAGKQAKSIKELADVINSVIREKDATVKTERLKELVGHTPLQVVCGALLGLTISILYIIIFKVY